MTRSRPSAAAQYVILRAGRITVTERVNLWFPSLDLEPTTLANYRYFIATGTSSGCTRRDAPSGVTSASRCRTRDYAGRFGWRMLNPSATPGQASCSQQRRAYERTSFARVPPT